MRVLSPRIDPPVRFDVGSTVRAQLIDGRRLADPRHAGDAETDRTAGIGQQQLQQFLRISVVSRLRALHQRDGPRQRRPVASQNARRVVGRGEDLAHRKDGPTAMGRDVQPG